MRIRGATCWLVLASLATVGLRAEAIKVEILRPAEGEPVADRVMVEASVRTERPLAAVELEVDGRVVHHWREPPYELLHDFGLGGREHVIVVRALTVDGDRAEASLTTRAIRVDEFVSLELQQLYATVVDRRGRRVTSLSRDDFSLRDAGVEQEIITFGVGKVPFTAVLLVDASLSMAGIRLDAALAAAERFVAGMRSHDQAQIAQFSDRLLQLTPVAGKDGSRSAATGSAEAQGGTAIRDHLFVALRLLEQRQGRRVAVLLTDGWDLTSVLAPEDLRAAAELSQSVVYWVRLAGDEPTTFQRLLRPSMFHDEFAAIRYHPALSSWRGRAEARKAYRDLEDLVGMTGGRVVTATDVDGIQVAVRDVLDELHEQYAIGYYPVAETPAGSWRPVDVAVKGTGLVIRAKRGYVDR